MDTRNATWGHLRNAYIQLKHSNFNLFSAGLDPANPGYSKQETENRLAPTDATVVEVIHTNVGGYGEEWACGTVDYYINSGGPTQPHCQQDGKTIQCVENTYYIIFIYWLNSIMNNKNNNKRLFFDSVGVVGYSSSSVNLIMSWIRCISLECGINHIMNS